MFRLVAELLEKLSAEVKAQGGLLLSSDEITAILARVSAKLSVRLSVQQSSAVIEAIKV